MKRQRERLSNAWGACMSFTLQTTKRKREEKISPKTELPDYFTFLSLLFEQ